LHALIRQCSVLTGFLIIHEKRYAVALIS
jgi:hypothetical protein